MFAENASGSDLNSNSVKLTFSLVGEKNLKFVPENTLRAACPSGPPQADTAWLKTAGRSLNSKHVPFMEEQF